MSDFIYIGGSPVDEPCAQIGVTGDAAKYNRLECQAYIVALRRKYGPEPEGAEFALKAEHHDFGRYYEVVCRFDPANEVAREYAANTERGIDTWAAVQMRAPVTYDERKEAIHFITDPDQWVLTTFVVICLADLIDAQIEKRFVLAAPTMFSTREAAQAYADDVPTHRLAFVVAGEWACLVPVVSQP